MLPALRFFRFGKLTEAHLRHEAKRPKDGPLSAVADNALLQADQTLHGLFNLLYESLRERPEEEVTYPEQAGLWALGRAGRLIERLRALNFLAGQRGGEMEDETAPAEALHVSPSTVRAFYCLKAGICLVLGRELDEDNDTEERYLDEVRGIARWDGDGPFGEYQAFQWMELSVGPGLTNWWYRIFSDHDA